MNITEFIDGLGESHRRLGAAIDTLPVQVPCTALESVWDRMGELVSDAEQLAAIATAAADVVIDQRRAGQVVTVNAAVSRAVLSDLSADLVSSVRLMSSRQPVLAAGVLLCAAASTQQPQRGKITERNDSGPYGPGWLSAGTLYQELRKIRDRLRSGDVCVVDDVDELLRRIEDSTTTSDIIE